VFDSTEEEAEEGVLDSVTATATGDDGKENNE